MDLKLQDKIAIVTGASRGIGRAIAISLAQEGCHLTITARDENLLAQTADVSDREQKASAWVYPSFGPGRTICRGAVPADAWRSWLARIDGPTRKPL